MKVLVISDIHGSENWNRELKEKIDSVDHVVFMGDYFDAWHNKWPDQGLNFIDIMQVKKDNPEKVHILWGNHDWSYMTSTRDGQFVSGHQNGKVLEIRNLLLMNYKLIDLAFECDGVVFSHGGFSKTWIAKVEEHLSNVFEILEAAVDDISFLNRYLHSQDRTADAFVKPDHGFDALLDWNGFFSGSGDEVCQGPLWIRPHSLLKDAKYNKQIVGHTEYCLDSFIKLKNDENKVVITDSHCHNVFEVIDTETYFEKNDFITEETLNKEFKNVQRIMDNVRSRKPKEEDMISEIEKEIKKTEFDFDAQKIYELIKFIEEDR